MIVGTGESKFAKKKVGKKMDTVILFCGSFPAIALAS
jgi:hypothetical protein